MPQGAENHLDFVLRRIGHPKLCEKMGVRLFFYKKVIDKVQFLYYNNCVFSAIYGRILIETFIFVKLLTIKLAKNTHNSRRIFK